MLIDLRHLLRNLRRSPTSAAAAVLTLSLTLGAGTAIFAVVDAVLLTPPPFTDPDALVTLGEVLPGDPASARRQVRYDTLEAWRERAGSLAAMEGADGTHLTLTGLGAADRVHITPPSRQDSCRFLVLRPRSAACSRPTISASRLSF